MMEDLTELHAWSEFVKVGHNSTAVYCIECLLRKWPNIVIFFIFILDDPRGSHSPRRKSLFFHWNILTGQNVVGSSGSKCKHFLEIKICQGRKTLLAPGLWARHWRFAEVCWIVLTVLCLTLRVRFSPVHVGKFLKPAKTEVRNRTDGTGANPYLGPKLWRYSNSRSASSSPELRLDRDPPELPSPS